MAVQSLIHPEKIDVHCRCRQSLTIIPIDCKVTNFPYACLLNFFVITSIRKNVTGSAKTEHNSAIQIFQYKALKHIG